MAIMASSRIFVKGLPPTITEKEFRKHFSANGREITDVKVIPTRRIGYVGYKSPEVATGAVKYFNRSFIRMSKVAVEIARPIVDNPRQKQGNSADAAPEKDPKPLSGSPEKSRDVKPQVENTKKRKREELDESDPKLREYLQVMHPKTKRQEVLGPLQKPLEDETPRVMIEENESDGEYEQVPARSRQLAAEEPPVQVSEDAPKADETRVRDLEIQDLPDLGLEPAQPAMPRDATDDDWLRSRTNRVLDLLDDDEALPLVNPSREAPQKGDVEMADVQTFAEPTKEKAPEGVDVEVGRKAEGSEADSGISLIQKTARLFVRNLPYSASQDDLRDLFGKYGNLEEVHLPLAASGNGKGYALVQYSDSASAIEAFQALDGMAFQGRLLHILPAEAKRDQGLDEFAISKLPLKKQNLIRKKVEAASSIFNWNSLYMSQDAVNASVADRLGVSKAELLDPTSADGAVKQAIAETSVIQETKAYFAANGVDLEAFKSRHRGDTAILVKNFPFGTAIGELRNMFQEHGPVLQVLMPPSGTIAIVQFAQPGHAKAAFGKLAYRRIKDSVLFLEKAPKGLFVESPGQRVGPATRMTTGDGQSGGVQKLSVTELLERDDGVDEGMETSSLYVRNLNFSTTTDDLANAFKSLEGFVSARVKTKTDVKKPGKVLSMGFGFVEFRTKAQASAAIKEMDGYTLSGHTLAVKPSHRVHDAAEERRREDAAKKAANQRTKMIIKNLPFEATKKDVRALLGTYGQLRAVRVPKKYDHSSRGFAFAEFVTPREAENALGALRDTHLLGRKLVIDYAEAETADPEEEIAKMQRKVGGQVNKVALQRLTSRGRTKVNIGDEDGDNEMDV